ncbi:MAG: O-antigen ligase family protein [Candidatus Staskawiczbacteria bacterium]|nr:O-antigen ligase family protein [Candidatus Staskawiczbacteria bacterium]
MISIKNFWDSIRQKYNVNKKSIWILSIILLIIVLSTLFSSDVIFSLWSSPHRSGGAINFIFCILFSIILYLTLKDRDWNKLWDFAFLIGDLVVVFAIIQYFDLLPKVFIAYEGRPPSTLSNPILLAIYLILLIFPAISYILREKSKKSVFYWSSTFLFIFGLFISGSRAAYLGLIVGVTYFLIFYPKKLLKMKIVASCFLLLMASGILYVSLSSKLPIFIESNPRLLLLADRISLTSIVQALGQTRFSAWKTFSNAIIEKPILGWGPENQSIAFDKYYDPNLNYLVKLGQDWWDRAHNIFIDLSVSFGVPLLIIYLFFFIYLFLKLQKNKKIQSVKSLPSHAIQATFLAYFTALIFGFDSVTTYLILFFIIGYSLYLISYPTQQDQQEKEAKTYYFLFKKRKIIIGIALILLTLFLWQYAIKPLYINAEISLAEKSNCKKRFSLFNNLLGSKSFLNSYLILKYVENIKNCENYIADNEAEYLNKAVSALKEEVKLQPKYTRAWLLLAQFNNTLLAMENNPEIKSLLEKDSLYYINQAKQLSPKRQEVFTSEIVIDFAKNDFEKMKKISQQCIKIDKNAAGCYWYLGLSEIIMKDRNQGYKDIETAQKEGYEYNNQISWSQLAIAYSQNKDYEKLAETYEHLLEFAPKNIDYRASLAFIYRELGNYIKAKKEALKILEINPDAEKDVNEFLSTLPR